MLDREEKGELKKIYEKSINFIELVSYKNGAILASDPKRRYDYVYPRDTALILRSLMKLEEWNKVKKSLDFFIKNQKETGEWAQRYRKDGKVASYRPPQVDCNGLILYAIRKYFESTGDKKFIKYAWPNIKAGAAFIIEHVMSNGLIFSTNSIHEWPPIEAGYDIWVNSTCYAGMRGAYKIAKSLGKNEAEEWRTLARRIWTGISKKLIKDGRFIKLSNHRIIEAADVSEFGPYLFGAINPTDRKMRNTVRKIRKDLWINELGGISRFPKNQVIPGKNNGGYGSYSMYTAWLGQYYLDASEEEKAKEIARWFIKYNKNGHIPEHVATKKEFYEWVEGAKKAGRYEKSARKKEAEEVMDSKEFKEKDLSYWVIPLTWAHAEFIIFYQKLKEKKLI